ncbi:hypothetical protein [Sphingomonas sp. Leaf20]|jgi:hypothetical protein|uniref:hypothetical protein n=1 Tax=Sphingomonas sp. Leaf20 TaxID=1735685 RepID=UPI000A56138A|nr:hypothetical protein [Sphingomonas sp. Leaf20]
MRPKSVVLAERLYLASIAILVLISVLTWDAAVAQGGVILAGGVTAFGIGLSLLLLILTTRKASRIALWLLIALTALGALGVAVQVSNGILATGLNGVLTIVQLVLTLIPIVLLFRPRARAWFADMAYRDDDYEGDVDDAEREA